MNNKESNFDPIQKIHSIIFKEDDITVFKSALNELDLKKRRQFINGCLYFCGSLEFNLEYCMPVKYVLLFTAIETIMSNPPHKEFDKWLITKDNEDSDNINKIISDISSNNFKDKIIELFNDYNKKYGATKAINKFFKDYINLADKKKIITDLSYPHGTDKIIAPSCFITQENCFQYPNTSSYTNACLKYSPNCILCSNQNKIEEINRALNKTINIISNSFRDSTVHEGERGWCDKGGITCNQNHELIKIDLSFDQFADIALKGIKEYYNKNIKYKKEQTYPKK